MGNFEFIHHINTLCVITRFRFQLKAKEEGLLNIGSSLMIHYSIINDDELREIRNYLINSSSDH